MMSPILNGGAKPGFGQPNPETVLKGTVESQRQEENSNTGSSDFDGKMNDPRARGAESNMDIIMNDGR